MSGAPSAPTRGLSLNEDIGQDILAGITHTRRGNHIASIHRKKQSFLGSRIAGYVVSALHNPMAHIRSMTPVERHSELVYAESLFEKASRLCPSAQQLLTLPVVSI